MNAPDVPTYDGDRSELPLGFRIDTSVLQQLDVPIETPVIFNAMRCPSLPLKATFTFSSGAAVIVTGGPPGEIEYARRELPVTERLSVSPPTVAETDRVREPASVGVYEAV